MVGRGSVENTGGEAVSVEELLKRLSAEAEREARRRKRGRGVVHGIARVLAYNGVITRGELEELSGGSSAGRQMIAFLKKCGLLYETHGGYILSVPWLVYFYRSLGEGWIERVRRLAPHISEDEIRELEELLREASQDALGEFVEAYIPPMKELQELVAVPARVVSTCCQEDWETCFHELLDYSKWLLVVLAGLLELYAKGAGYNEVLAWLSDMAKRFREWLSMSEGQSSCYERLVSETASALKRDAVRLYETRYKLGGVLEKALQWALEQYRRSSGRQVDRARYYAGILLRETVRAVLADVSTRIALLP